MSFLWWWPLRSVWTFLAYSRSLLTYYMQHPVLDRSFIASSLPWLTLTIKLWSYISDFSWLSMIFIWFLPGVKNQTFPMFITFDTFQDHINLSLLICNKSFLVSLKHCGLLPSHSRLLSIHSELLFFQAILGFLKTICQSQSRWYVATIASCSQHEIGHSLHI